MAMGHMLKNKKISQNVSAGFHPGSRQVLRTITKSGDLDTLASAGLRLLESSCGACIGMGFSPNSKSVSLRTFNRNFEGRSGTASAEVYLCSPEVAIASAITGYITDPRTLGIKPFKFKEPEYIIDDSMIIPPILDGSKVEVIRGPNIKPLPVATILEDKIKAKVSLKVGDNITTDDIMPAGSKILPLRSNIPAISEYVYINIDSNFAKRAKELQKSFIVGGANYGQGSSREHAALAPMYLGVKAVIAKSFARIHKANLINFGIVPLTFKKEEDYLKIEQGDTYEIDFLKNLEANSCVLKNIDTGIEIHLKHDLNSNDIDVLKKGGRLQYARSVI